jgi:hypothetical protein
LTQINARAVGSVSFFFETVPEAKRRFARVQVPEEENWIWLLSLKPTGETEKPFDDEALLTSVRATGSAEAGGICNGQLESDPR